MDMPYLLSYGLQCSRWGVLPEGGGLRDQPAGILDKMAYMLGVFRAAKGYASADDPTKWADNNSDAWELYARARQIEKALNE